MTFTLPPIFNVTHGTSLQWIEEVRNICGPTIPILLVGCKADLRPSPDSPNFVSRSQAERVASAIGARAYKECSALKIEGVDDVFEAATRASMLMREGVPTNGIAPEKHHRRKSSGKIVMDDEGAGRCCVVC
jgi:Rho family protein